MSILNDSLHQITLYDLIEDYYLSPQDSKFNKAMVIQDWAEKYLTKVPNMGTKTTKLPRERYILDVSEYGMKIMFQNKFGQFKFLRFFVTNGKLDANWIDSHLMAHGSARIIPDEMFDNFIMNFGPSKYIILACHLS